MNKIHRVKYIDPSTQSEVYRVPDVSASRYTYISVYLSIYLFKAGAAPMSSIGN